jgi:hypothetical protein
MNPIQFYEFGKSRGGIPNTFIGGVSATIGTAAALASRLAINVDRITLFEIVGEDIKCRVTGNYNGLGSGFDGNTAITYYDDSEGLLVNMSDRFISACSILLWINFPKLKTTLGQNFNYCPLIKRIELPELLSSTGQFGSFTYNDSLQEIILPKLITVRSTSEEGFAQNNRNLTMVYIPVCTELGSSQLRNPFNFRPSGSNLNRLKIICNPYFQTSNAGAEEGDIAYARSQGAIVRYITNFTSPNPVTTLTTGTIYNTAIQLNFTPPTGSTNAIEFYECYANGVLKNNITASGQYITGLTANTAYQFTVIAVDVFYNKSVVSNSVSASTNNTFPFNISGLVSYYKLESSSTDYYGTNNGVDTAVTYGVGKIGNGAIFNGTTSNISIQHNSNLSFTNGTSDFFCF